MLYFLLAANAVFASALLLDLLRVEPLIGDWVRVPYLLSYTHGFVKRGLLGTLLSALHLSPSTTTVFILYVLVFESFLVLFYLFVVREGRDNPLLPYLLVLFLLSPATIFHMGDDVGRTDVYLYLILLLSLNCPRLSPVLTVLALLVHEGYVLMGLPVLLLGVGLKGFKRIALANGAVAGVGVMLLSLLGRLDGKGMEVYSHILSSYGITTMDPLLPLHLSPLQNSFHFYTKFLADPATRTTILLGVASALLLVLLYSLLLFRISRAPIHLKAVPLSPLLMFLFGVDYFRWSAAAVIGMALAFVLLGRRFGVRRPDRFDKVLFLLSLLALPLEVLKELLT